MATRLKIKIVEKDMSQGELARIVGISETTVSSLVRGKTEPSIKVALKIAKTLNTSVEELWGYLVKEDER